MARSRLVFMEQGKLVMYAGVKNIYRDVLPMHEPSIFRGINEHSNDEGHSPETSGHLIIFWHFLHHSQLLFHGVAVLLLRPVIGSNFEIE